LNINSDCTVTSFDIGHHSYVKVGKEFIDKNYHLNKTELCEQKGIRLIHIFEDEWLNKQDIVKSRLKNILGLTENKVYGRKCQVKEISNKDYKLFLKVIFLQKLYL
jgi:hypothetical protein